MENRFALNLSTKFILLALMSMTVILAGGGNYRIAAIEASHAGEIRNLAESSSEQAHQTGATIHAIMNIIKEIFTSSQVVEHSFEELGKLFTLAKKIKTE